MLVLVDFKKDRGQWAPREVLDEMRELVRTSGGDTVGEMICPNVLPTAGYIIGSGKIEEIANLCSELSADTVIFSCDLKGSQQRNLEEKIPRRIIDRTELILHIFAQHATSMEGKMQVELAQLEYRLPRLRGHGVEMSRLGGGIGTMGPGETKLEVDKRRITDRITRLQHELKGVAENRGLKRKKRKDMGTPTISLIGYTNAGKSTLLNTLTDAGQRTHDGLFTTLDSLSRQLILPNHQKVILTDTVGFMHDLPHRLIEAFKATLEEVQEADLLLHVLDVSHPHFDHLYDAVVRVLTELEAHKKPLIVVLNKIDLLADRSGLDQLAKSYDEAVCISGKSGENVQVLLELIQKRLSSMFVEVNVMVPIKRMDLVNFAHEEGEVYSIKYYEDRINIRASMPAQMCGQFYAAAIPSKKGKEMEQE